MIILNVIHIGSRITSIFINIAILIVTINISLDQIYVNKIKPSVNIDNYNNNDNNNRKKINKNFNGNNSNNSNISAIIPGDEICINIRVAFFFSFSGSEIRLRQKLVHFIDDLEQFGHSF